MTPTRRAHPPSEEPPDPAGPRAPAESPADDLAARVGVVAIGRNEGDRLRRCLESVRGSGGRIVYVDSASSDGSPRLAESLGAEVVNLDMARPFTAARARNEGFARLTALDPSLEFVQFLDGDCELVPGWLDRACVEMRSDPMIGAVCGRRRERHPDASIYNRLCDQEWDTPVGDALACGGDALFRAAAFRLVGGFDARLIAGEEPELCVRLRACGFRVRRIAAEMTIHDAAMTSFRQWWRRAVRAGHAFAEGAALHGRSKERHWVRETASALFWGAGLPAVVVLLAPVTSGWSLAAGLAAYAHLFLKTLRSASRRWPVRDAARYALFCVVAKAPQAYGAAQFAFLAAAGRRRTVVDWKAT